MFRNCYDIFEQQHKELINITIDTTRLSEANKDLTYTSNNFSSKLIGNELVDITPDKQHEELVTLNSETPFIESSTFTTTQN